MSASSSPVVRLHHAIQEKLVWVLLGTYALAIVAPGPGLAIRAASVGTIHAGGSSLAVTAPTVLLAVLLLNASLGVNAAEIRKLVGRPRAALAGLLANSALPLVFTLLAAGVLRLWTDHDEVQNLLVGLAIVGAMPIAGSSTAWSQNAEGNLALSVGLVLASTLLSPLLTPLGFHAIAAVTSGDYSDDLVELAGGGTQLFLALAVVVPSLLGISLRTFAGPERLAPFMPWVKLANQAVILVLNYANASVALPQVLRRPDLDYIALIFATVGLLCGTAFACGRWVGEAVGAEEPERVSLMFALGMNNNGSGLVLASSTLADHPNVLLAIVAYNLVQQIAAGAADHLAQRRRGATRA